MRLSPLQRNILYSQICLWATLTLCVILAPASLGANSGISYFGHHSLTVVPFELGMITTAYFLLQAERLVRPIRKFKLFYWCLILMIVGIIGIAIAPAVGNGLLDQIHRIFGSLAFITQLVLAAWLITKVKSDIVNWLLYLLQFLGGIMALLYLQPAQGFSIQGQILFQLAFSAILIRGLPNLKDADNDG